MLENIPLFEHIPQASREALEQHMRTRNYARNAIILSEGDEATALFVILSGHVKIVRNDAAGNEVILRMQGPGECFGELALIDGEPRSTSVVTLDKCEFSILRKREFDEQLDEHPEMARKMLPALTQHIRVLTDEVKDLALLDVYGRVAKTLQRMASGEVDGNPAIEQRLTHQAIASMVGASREMVTRIFKDLTQGGYISNEDGTIVIRKPLPSGW